MSLNVNILSEGYELYMKQLKRQLWTCIYDGLLSIYEDSIKIEKETNRFGGNKLKQFQTLLKQIPVWNQSILEQETHRILDEINILPNMVTVLIVAQVQILASIKLGGSNGKIRVHIPNLMIFVHEVYKRCAEIFYYNPYPFINVNNRNNIINIRECIESCIENTILDMVPVKSILNEYMSGGVDAMTREKYSDENRDSNGIYLDSEALRLDSFDKSVRDPIPDRKYDDNVSASVNSKHGHSSNIEEYDTPDNELFKVGGKDTTMSTKEFTDEDVIDEDVTGEVDDIFSINNNNNETSDDLFGNVLQNEGNIETDIETDTDILKDLFSDKEETNIFDSLGETSKDDFDPFGSTEKDNNLDPFGSSSEVNLENNDKNDPFGGKDDSFSDFTFSDDKVTSTNPVLENDIDLFGGLS